jgi:tetratricopeptide (TPR) repeat protein
LASGCVSDASPGKPPGFPWVTESEVPQTRGQLKNPAGLDLSYAQWQEQLGNLNEAKDGYSRVLNSQPHSLDALLGLARLEQLAGHSEAAEMAFRQVVKEVPGNAQALDALGQFYVGEKRLPEAISTLEQATRIAPDDAVCRHHLAVALARSGDTAQALAQFTKAVGEAEAHYNVGYILYEQGRKDLAEREFLQAVTLQPNLTSAQTMLDELRHGRRQPPVGMQTAGNPAKPDPASEPAPSRPVITQTVATLPPEIPHYVNPAVATKSEASPAAASNANKIAISQPIWQMPTRRDSDSVFAEQLQNQTQP